MATKTKKKKASKPGLSAGTRKVHHIKRKKPRKKKMLSEFFSDKGAGKAAISGAVGGAASVVVDFVAPGQTPVTRGLIKIAAGYGTAKFLGMNNVGAGMAGAGAYQMMASSLGLSEGDGQWAEDIESLPEFMSEGNVLLSEEQANAMLSQPGYLQDRSYMPGYAPSFNYGTYQY